MIPGEKLLTTMHKIGVSEMKATFHRTLNVFVIIGNNLAVV